MRILGITLLIIVAVAWLSMHQPKLIASDKALAFTSSSLPIEKRLVLSRQSKKYVVANSVDFCTNDNKASDLNEWGMPYDFQYGQSLDSDWLQKQSLKLSELLNLAEHGDAIAMLRVAQLAFHHALPKHGFLQDSLYQGDQSSSVKRNSSELQAYNPGQAFSLAAHWAKQAALYGKAYGFNLLGRAYLSKLMQSEKPDAQWLVKYFTYTQLWQQHAGEEVEGHAMLEVLKEVEVDLKPQITEAKQAFHQQRIQLGLLSPSRC